jgi:hypothetical protein
MFSTKFAEQAYLAELNGDDDFKHECNLECEGTHELEWSDPL